MTGLSDKARVSIRPARHGDLDRLLDIEHAATAALARFVPALAEAAPTDRYRFAGMLRRGESLVATLDDGTVAGFAIAGPLGGIYWLTEMGVDPSSGRRGIGTALLLAVIERARWADHPAIGLTTFRDVPFNAPFYARHGFIAVDPAELEPEIGGRLAAETPAGTDPDSRVMMFKRL